MKWDQIKAYLVARDSDELDLSCGYSLELPLDENMMLIPEDWHSSERPYTVSRFWSGEPNIQGQLIHVVRNSWRIEYPYPEQAESTVQLGLEHLDVGEFVNIRDHSDVMHIFRIKTVEEVHWFPTKAHAGH